MERNAEDVATRLVNQLAQELSEGEDARSAVAAYKVANWIIRRLEEFKVSALNLAGEDMSERGLEALQTPAGSAGWTEPQVRQLDEQAWLEALARDPRLRRIQREYDVARAALEQAQEPYKELPEPWFFIR